MQFYGIWGAVIEVDKSISLQDWRDHTNETNWILMKGSKSTKIQFLLAFNYIKTFIYVAEFYSGHYFIGILGHPSPEFYNPNSKSKNKWGS